jgi:dihydroxy-acid dehydratase
MSSPSPRKPLRSENWFNNHDRPDMTAIYVERFMNCGLTRAELQSGRPVIGIAQTGSDLTPCNRIHLELVERVKAGVRDAGGLPFVFPVHPLQESCRRPTAALDRNLAYLGLVEVLHGYPLDGVVLMTGCDKTTPACLMAVATTDTPAIVLSGGPMLDGWFEGRRTGSGMAVWEARRRLEAGETDYEGFMDLVCASTPSPGHCNTMGTALSMNSLAEALGMSLPGCAAIPAPYRERSQMAYATGRRAVGVVQEDLRPSRLLTPAAFANAIVVNTALGGSTNCPVHLSAIARHAGFELPLGDWERLGYDVPLLVNCQPAGEHLGEGFHRAGGMPAVLHELLRDGRLDGGTLTINGRTLAENCADTPSRDHAVIRPCSNPLRPRAGFLVLSGNLFNSALIKTSVISEDFRRRFLSRPGQENRFESKVIVFENYEDYHGRINDPALEIDESCMLVIRGSGPVGYPGAGEVVNMLPPDYLLRSGVSKLPCMGDGRQSGTSDSPSILNVSPESAVGGNLALLKTGDRVRVDLEQRRVDLLVSDEELARRRSTWKPPALHHQTPWQEMQRSCVGQLDTGACLESATRYRAVADDLPRHNH